jgi:amino acid transporter
LERPVLGILISFGATISLFGCTVATLLAVSRIGFALARQGALPATLGEVNVRHSIPRNAVMVAVVLVLATGVAFGLFAKPMDVYDWFGSFATFGFIGAYGLTCVSMPLYLRAQGELRARHVAVSVAALGVLGYVLVASVYPAPAAPLNLLPWLFLGLLAAGALGSFHLLGRRRKD